MCNLLVNPLSQRIHKEITVLVSVLVTKLPVAFDIQEEDHSVESLKAVKGGTGYVQHHEHT